MPKKKSFKKGLKHHIAHHIKRNAGFVTTLLLIVAILMGSLFAGSLFGPKFNPNSNAKPLSANYLCCDSGDGDACKPIEDKKIVWKGTNAQPQEYGLLKSGIALAEGTGHLKKDENALGGESVYINTSDKTASYEETAGCEGGKDLIFGQSEFGQQQCQGIPDDSIIYVCTTECPGDAGSGKFDAYLRLSDYSSTGVPEPIRMCKKPGSQNAVATENSVVYEQQPGKENLQLQTFKVVQTAVGAPWLSPYCKPAIYLYPEGASFINVKVNSDEPFTYTDPLYPQNGWSVLADTNGILNYNNKIYDYLYYETRVSDEKIKRPDKGFVIKSDELSDLLSDILPKLGLNIRETQQFSDYWLSALPESPYYFIGVISQEEIEQTATLSILPEPQTVIRVTLYFETLDEKSFAERPVISTPVRTGFTVVEWGGIFKRHANEKFSCFE